MAPFGNKTFCCCVATSILIGVLLAATGASAALPHGHNFDSRGPIVGERKVVATESCSYVTQKCRAGGHTGECKQVDCGQNETCLTCSLYIDELPQRYEILGGKGSYCDVDGRPCRAEGKQGRCRTITCGKRNFDHCLRCLAPMDMDEYRQKLSSAVELAKTKKVANAVTQALAAQKRRELGIRRARRVRSTPARNLDASKPDRSARRSEDEGTSTTFFAVAVFVGLLILFFVGRRT